MKQIAVRIEDEPGEAFEALAKRNFRSVAAEARLALLNHLKSNGSGATSPEAAPEPQRKEISA